MLVGVGRAVLLARDVGPLARKTGVELEPFLQAALGVGKDRLGGALGLAHAAVDAFVGVDDQHHFALVETIDRADLDAVHIFAFDAGVGDDVGHVFALPLAASLCRRAHRVNAQLRVTGPRLGGGAAPLGKAEDAENAHPAVERKRDGAADADVLARLFDAFAVDADIAGFYHRLG